MKICKQCSVVKEESEFGKKRDGTTSQCLECQRKYNRAWYRAKPRYYVDKNNRARIKKRAFVWKLKENTPCADCKKQYPSYVMDFDHLRDKHRIISRLVTSGTWKQIREEIAKCEIVCANCHRERTYKRNQEEP